MRLRPLAARLGVPVLVINDSPIKQFAENRHAVGQSVLESYLRITNQMTNGLRVAVFGYGACGKGVAANFRNACAPGVGRRDRPVARLRGAPRRIRRPVARYRFRTADVVITVTGAGRDERGRPSAVEGRRGPDERRALPRRDRRRRSWSFRPGGAAPPYGMTLTLELGDGRGST